VTGWKKPGVPGRAAGVRVGLAGIGALALIGTLSAGPAAAASGSAAGTGLDDSSGTAASAQPCEADSGQQNDPKKAMKSAVPGTPWSLQRFDLSQLHGLSEGSSVTVAVLDTGVSSANSQLSGAVSAGPNEVSGNAPTTQDPVGHGTEVAGIIAARASGDNGFQGLAPQAKILSVRASDAKGNGSAAVLAKAVRAAADGGAGVINISQDVQSNNIPVAQSPTSDLAKAVDYAVHTKDAVVVASAGNEGLDQPTYPAAFPGVLAVGASDYNDERADFSEMGDFVGVAAPGVDMTTTWPAGGLCAADGTSFSAPYVSGLAALIRSAHPDWTAAKVITRIEQTAQRPGRKNDDYIGWGVVDPIAALSDQSTPADAPTEDPPARLDSAAVQPRPYYLGESPEQREQRTATYAVATGAVLALLISGGAVVVRDAGRRRRSRRDQGD
jgi:type VII secretion-associated serine protease mycosin